MLGYLALSVKLFFLTPLLLAWERYKAYYLLFVLQVKLTNDNVCVLIILVCADYAVCSTSKTLQFILIPLPDSAARGI